MMGEVIEFRPPPRGTRLSPADGVALNLLLAAALLGLAARNIGACARLMAGAAATVKPCDTE